MVSVFEVIDACDERSRAAKEAVKDTFAAAWTHLQAGEFGKAAKRFDRVLQQLPGDPPATLHRDVCRRFLDDGAPRDWDGATTMTSK